MIDLSGLIQWLESPVTQSFNVPKGFVLLVALIIVYLRRGGGDYI